MPDDGSIGDTYKDTYGIVWTSVIKEGCDNGSVAKAVVALHKYQCRGLCAFPCQEPKQTAYVCITAKENMADAVRVGLCTDIATTRVSLVVV